MIHCLTDLLDRKFSPVRDVENNRLNILDRAAIDAFLQSDHHLYQCFDPSIIKQPNYRPNMVDEALHRNARRALKIYKVHKNEDEDFRCGFNLH